MTDEKEKALYLIICKTPKGIAIRKNKVYTYSAALQAIKKCPTNRDGVKWVMHEITELKRIGGKSMNFWERKDKYKSGQNPTPSVSNGGIFESTKKQSVADLIHGEYIYRDLNGIEKPIILKNVTIENSFSATAVIIKGHNKKMPYKDMLKEIDRMLNTNNSLWNGNPIALHGIPLEDYTTKDLYDELIKTLGAKA